MTTNDAISDFGRRLGLADFALDERGRAALEFDGLGSVAIERAESGSPAEGDLVLALALPATPGETPDVGAVLGRASWEASPDLPLHAGVFHGRVVFALRFDETRVTGADLENGLRALVDAARGLNP